MEITLSLATVIIGVVGMIVGLISGFMGFMTFVSERPTRTEMNEALAAQLAASDARWEPIKADLDYIRKRLDKMGDQ